MPCCNIGHLDSAFHTRDADVHGRCYARPESESSHLLCNGQVCPSLRGSPVDGGPRLCGRGLCGIQDPVWVHSLEGSLGPPGLLAVQRVPIHSPATRRQESSLQLSEMFTNLEFRALDSAFR